MNFTSLTQNIRFYVLSFSILLSIALFFYIKTTIEEGPLQIIKLTQYYALTTVTYLYIVLMATPLTRTFRSFPYKGQYIKARRALGVSTFYFGLLHGSLAFFGQLGGFPGLTFLDSKYLLAITLSFTALVILATMASTSFDFIIAKLGHTKWKFIHRFVYLAALFITIHGLMLGSHFQDLSQLIPRIFSVALAILLILEAKRFDAYLQGKFANFPKFGFSLFFVLALILGYLIFSINKEQIIGDPKVNIKSNTIPIPFEDLTIQFLRNKKYDSSLSVLDQISSDASYISYLASYTSDGLKINGLLTKPNADPPTGGFPAIIFIHGYIPPTSYNTLTRYEGHVDFLSRNGFVVFKIDLRGHGDSDGESGGAYYSSDYVIDVLNAYAALQSSEFVNPKEIGLWGHSMAGNVVSRAMAANVDIPAVVIWAGAVYSYTDLADYGIQDSSYQQPSGNAERQKRRQKLRETYGEPKDGNPFWQKVAMTSFLNDLKGAIQIHHAVDDNVVSIGYSRNLNSLLDKTNVPHELKEYPSGGHNITGVSFTEAMQSTVDFFKKHL